MGIWIKTKNALIFVNSIKIFKHYEVIDRKEVIIFTLTDDRMNNIARYDSEEGAINGLNFIERSIIEGAKIVEIND